MFQSDSKIQNITALFFTIFILIATGVMLKELYVEHISNRAGEIGRFQVIQQGESNLILLDSATGQTWFGDGTIWAPTSHWDNKFLPGNSKAGFKSQSKN